MIHYQKLIFGMEMSQINQQNKLLQTGVILKNTCLFLFKHLKVINMKKLSFKQRQKIKLVKKWFCTRKVSRDESYKVRNAFRTFFDGIYNSSFGWEADEIFYLQDPCTSVSLYQLQIHNLKVYRYKGVLTMEIETERPGICIGKGGKFIDEYRKYMRKYLNDETFSIHIVESKALFNY